MEPEDIRMTNAGAELLSEKFLSGGSDSQQTALSSAQEILLNRYQQQLATRRYSPKTRKNYCAAFVKFLRYIAPRLPLEVEKATVAEWLEREVCWRNLSGSYQNTCINAVKFYYEVVEGLPCERYRIPRPRRDESLPEVLSRAEIRQMISQTQNLKHRCILMLAYGAGLRLSEILNLTPQDIDLKRMVIRIRHDKRKKDREVPLSPLLLDHLRQYCQQERPRVWLFEGTTAGKRYSERSAEEVVRRAAERAGIRRKVSIHMLRHSYAAHLLEAGASIHYLQEMLGHDSIKTTERYLYVARSHQPPSPLEDLGV
ncbi:MAG: tyrosine-type recombinase/integrase [Saprospiraceae bacterium]|nr:site-specific integrase [Saprospiraceae bacterium]MDW8229828.1 tyrosine-type recombinase/integrase [Saprospiraceae bacterium]